MTLTEAQKQSLLQMASSGKRIRTVAYNPSTLTGTNPEADATAAGWTQFYREASATLVEAIYTANPSSNSATIGGDESSTYPDNGGEYLYETDNWYIPLGVTP